MLRTIFRFFHGRLFRTAHRQAATRCPFPSAGFRSRRDRLCCGKSVDIPENLLHRSADSRPWNRRSASGCRHPGRIIKEPKAPTRDGYTFDGWYSDIYLEQPWDFENDIVKDNMTLYAAWKEGSPISSTKLLWLLPPLLLLSIAALWLYRRKKKAE